VATRAEDDALAEVTLSVRDLLLLCEALDTYEYWELGDTLPRNNGAVWIPGDLLSDEDHYWKGIEPSPAQSEAIQAVRDVRELAERLMRALDLRRAG
jgi:hypothetical protein